MLARNTELYASWITIAASYGWLPLVLAGAVLLLRFPGKAKGILTFSIAAGLLALASPSQPVIHASLSCVVLFAAGIGWLFVQRRFGDVWRVAWSLLVCSAIAFGLAAAATLPMYLAIGEMIRHVGAGAAVIGHAHIPWKSFNLNQLSLSQAAGIVIRPTWIHIVGSPYVGPLGVTGALLACIYFRRLDSFRRTLVIAFGVIGLYGLLSAFGTNLGLAYLNFHFPFTNRIREAGRHLVLFVIGISFLSGIGYSRLAGCLEQYKGRRDPRLLIAPAMLAIAFAGVVLWEVVHNGAGRTPTGLWILALAPGLFLLARMCSLSACGNVVLAALLVSVAAVVIPVRGFSVSQSEFDKPMNLLSHRVLQKVASEIDASGYRVDFRDSAFNTKFWAMNASYYSIKSFYNQLTPQPYGQFRFMLLSDIPHLREMMGARYVLCGPNDWPLDPTAKQILETEGYRLYENPSPMERLTLVHRVAGLTHGERGFTNVVRNGFNYFSEAYVRPRDFNVARRLLGVAQPPSRSGERIANLLNQANRTYSTVESDAASLLILNEWFTPAWKVRVNGKHQSTLRVNQWQTGVLVPAGKNRVEFEYRPALFRVLIALHRITMVLVLVFVICAVTWKDGRFPRRFSTIA